MKKILNILAATLCFLYIACLPLRAQCDGESIDPPIFPSPCNCVSVLHLPTSIEVGFLEEATAEIEVVAENGTAVFQSYAMVDRNSQIFIDRKRWSKGRYTIRVKMNGQLVKQQIIHVE